MTWRLASASNAVILGFHNAAGQHGGGEGPSTRALQIKLYAIIYELIDQVKESLAGLAGSVEQGSGHRDGPEVRQIFELSKGARRWAGSMITSGRVVQGQKARGAAGRKGRHLRGQLSSRCDGSRDEVNEVRAGMECGIRIEGYSDFQVGDIVESYTIEKFAQKL